ncbi:MAG TPA: hypothetical protein VGX96_11625 [Candidatus Elarobacter sp.]|jgi:hypothetical protein|nr:hypothetical protein [Candidatus Elarobacter sp.]
MRDLFEAVEHIEDEQSAQAGGLHCIADAIDHIQKRIDDICGILDARGETSPRRVGVTAQPDSREDLNASPTVDHDKRTIP